MSVQSPLGESGNSFPFTLDEGTVTAGEAQEEDWDQGVGVGWGSGGQCSRRVVIAGGKKWVIGKPRSVSEERGQLLSSVQDQ